MGKGGSSAPSGAAAPLHIAAHPPCCRLSTAQWPRDAVLARHLLAQAQAKLRNRDVGRRTAVRAAQAAGWLCKMAKVSPTSTSRQRSPSASVAPARSTSCQPVPLR